MCACVYEYKLDKIDIIFIITPFPNNLLTKTVAMKRIASPKKFLYQSTHQIDAPQVDIRSYIHNTVLR